MNCVSIPIRMKWIAKWPEFPQYHSLSSLLTNPAWGLGLQGKETGRESYNSVPKVIFSTVGGEGTINSTDPSYSVFNFMLLVYNMISYHPEFQKWPSGLVGCWGQERDDACDAQGSWLWPVLPRVPLCRGRSAPGLAAQRLSSLLVHKVIRWWRKLRVSLPEIWLSLPTTASKGKV